MLIITDSYWSSWHLIYIPNLIHDCPGMIYSRENHQPPVALETKKPNITFYSWITWLRRHGFVLRGDIPKSVGLIWWFPWNWPFKIILPLRRVFEVDKHRFYLLSAEMCRKKSLLTCGGWLDTENSAGMSCVNLSHVWGLRFVAPFNFPTNGTSKMAMPLCGTRNSSYSKTWPNSWSLILFWVHIHSMAVTSHSVRQLDFYFFWGYWWFIYAETLDY